MATDLTKDESNEETPRSAGVRSRPSTGLAASFYTVKQYRSFRFLWIGNFFTVGAQWLQILTIGWLVLELTDGNALLTGTVVGIRTLPVLLVGPWAGVLADRLDRRKIVMITQALMAVAASSFAVLVISTDLNSDPISGPLKWWHPFIYMVIAGVAHSVIQPVRQAMVANTVPRRDLTSALALSGMAHPIMRITGPAIGGLLIATLGFKWNFFLEATAYLGIVLMILPVKLIYREEGSHGHFSAMRSIEEGLRYVWQEKSILQLLVMSIIPNFVFQPLAFLLPVFTTEVLHRGPGSGGLLAAAIGGGGICAAVIISGIGYVFRKGITSFIGLIGGCVFILVFSQSHWFWASMLLLGGLGFCQYIFRVGNSTMLQTIVPDNLRGRVMSIYFVDNGFTPLATLLISLFVYVWNPSAAFTVVAAVSLSLALLQLLTFRLARQLE